MIKDKQSKNAEAQEIKQFKKSRVVLAKRFKLQNLPETITFNNTESMIFIIDTNVKLLSLFGQLKLLRNFSDNIGWVYCMVNSKKISWFATGNHDRSLRCWQEQTSGEWKCFRPQQRERILSSRVTNFILNNKEDQLISSCSDNTIIIWKVNCQINQFEYDYKLESKHTRVIECISLNEIDTQFITTSKREIILWKKGQMNQWEQQNMIVNSIQGIQICFIDNNSFVWQSGIKLQTHLYEIQNGQLIKAYELNLNSESKETVDQINYSFSTLPIVFNKRKQIMIQSADQFIYIVQIQQQGKLALLCDPIDCKKKCLNGNLTQNGEILVSNSSREFRIYKILLQ